MSGKHLVVGLLSFVVLTGLAIFQLIRGASAGPPAIRAIAAAKLPDPDGDTAKLYIQRCAGCHALADPAMHTPAEWPLVVRRMGAHAASRWLPVPAEREARTLVDYLSASARP